MFYPSLVLFVSFSSELGLPSWNILYINLLDFLFYFHTFNSTGHLAPAWEIRLKGMENCYFG